MFYDFEFTIPAGTAQASPETKDLQLAHGVIHTFRLFVPHGPRGEVSLIIRDVLHQVYPTNEDGAFTLDNVYVAFDDDYELTEPPYMLRAYGWSPDASYDHTVHIEIGLLESKLARASLRAAIALEKFIKYLGGR